MSPRSNTPGAGKLKAWMNDASDAEEDFRFALTDKDAKSAGAALTKIEDLDAEDRNLLGREEGE